MASFSPPADCIPVRLVASVAEQEKEVRGERVAESSCPIQLLLNFAQAFRRRISFLSPAFVLPRQPSSATRHRLPPGLAEDISAGQVSFGSCRSGRKIRTCSFTRATAAIEHRRPPVLVASEWLNSWPPLTLRGLRHNTERVQLLVAEVDVYVVTAKHIVR